MSANHQSQQATNNQGMDNNQSMDTSTLFEQVKLCSMEIHSLIRQGVRQGIDERIMSRNQLMQTWFERVQLQIKITDQQQEFLENLLKEERALLHQLQDEQQKMTDHQTAARKLQSYKSVYTNKANWK